MAEIIITRRDGNWTYGHIGEYDFEVKHWPEPSSFGIEEGRIIKLWVSRHNAYGEAVTYDRGWDRLPRTQEELDITQAIIDRFN